MQDKGKHYVYVCYVDEEMRYVGIGKGQRYKHCTSGTSSCSELNRDFHAGKNMKVEIIYKNLHETEALAIESKMIEDNFDQLYNKVIQQVKVSRANCKKSKTIKVLCSNWSLKEDAVKFSEYLMDILGVDVESHFYQSLVDGLTIEGLAIYVTELPTKTKTVVIDKIDDLEREKYMADKFAHLAHPDGLYDWSTGMDMALGKY